MSRTAIVTLSAENLLRNLSIIKQQAPNSKIIAMVKANAYGHGLRSVALRIANHVDMLGVASIDEAVALRKVGVKTAIMLAEGVFEPSELIVAAEEAFHVVFHNEEQLKWLGATSINKPVYSWLKVDSGMGRLGFNLDEACHYYQQLVQSSKTAKPVRLMSHFACADEYAHPLNQLQLDRFAKLSGRLNAESSFANSAAIFHFPESHYHYVRPGLALYGAFYSDAKGCARPLGLKPVMTVKSSIIAVRHMQKGSPLGYGARFICPEDMLVGIVAFGYGDGYPRSARDGTPILVNNTRCQLIGRVSMDMLAVDLRPCPDAIIGDPVILWGESLPVEEVASYTAHIAYDLLTCVQHRVRYEWTDSVSASKP